MASVARGQIALNKTSSKATGNPNPTSAEYAAQRGSIDVLMRAKEGKAPTSSGGVRGAEAAAATAAGLAPPKMSFLEAIRAQRQVRVKELRDAPKSSGAPGGTTITSAITSEPTSNFHKGSGGGGGGFSSLASSGSSNKTPKAKAKPSNTAWVAALASPSPNTTTNTSAASTTTTTASFAQVQEELEAGFQRYSRANPLGGVGAARSGDAEGGQQKQLQNQGHSQSHGQVVPTTATARNLKARQLMVAPQSSARREEERAASMKKKPFNNGGDDSSDEDVGRSALGRKKARKG